MIKQVNKGDIIIITLEQQTVHLKVDYIALQAHNTHKSCKSGTFKAHEAASTAHL